MRKIVFVFLIFFLIAGRSLADDMKTQAKSLFDSIKGKFNTPQALNQNFVGPTLGNGTLSTFDNNKTFSANVACPSSTKFLEIIMQPQSNGNVNFNVYFDSNFDGSVDRTQYFSGISGLCGDGIIKCDAPVSWRNCRVYRINFNGNSFIETEASLQSLSHCFAMTNQQGTLIAKDYILSTLGGVLIGALQRYNSHFAISRVKIQDVVITYYGQDSQKCNYNKNATTSGAENPEIYFGGAYSGDFSMAYQMASTGKSLQQSSPFTSMFASIYSNMTERSCEIKRVINQQSINWQDTVTSTSSPYCPSVNTYSLCGDACLQIQVPMYISAGSAYTTSLNLNMPSSMIPYLSQFQIQWCTQTTGPYPCTDDDGWYRFYLNGQLVASGSYKNSEDCGAAPNGGCWHVVRFSPGSLSNTATITVAIGGAGGGQGVQAGCRVLYVNLLFSKPLTSCEITENRIDDGCVSLRNNSDCSLKDKYIGGTPVIQNGINTGLKPLTTCQEICGETYCYDDWDAKEVYLCKNNSTQLDFTRAQKILSTINYDGNFLTFGDIRKENGTWKDYPNQSIQLQLEKGEACPQVCKVKIWSMGNEVGEKGPSEQFRYQNSPKVLYDYRECVDNVCPYDPNAGEEMVQACGCLTDFNDVAVSLQAIRLAGQDLICSSGIEKTLPGW